MYIKEKEGYELKKEQGSIYKRVGGRKEKGTMIYYDIKRKMRKF